MHGTRRWGCLNFRGRLNSCLSPLPPVIGDVAAEGGGGDGVGGDAGASLRGTWAGAGWPRGQLLQPASRVGREAAPCVEMGSGGGRGAASRPRPEGHLTVPAAQPGGLGWRGRPGRGSPAQSPRHGGGRRAPAPGTARSPVAVPASIPAGGRGRLFVGSAPAFLAGWLPVTEVIHSFQNCLGAGAGAEPARGCSPSPLPSYNRFSPARPPQPEVPPGRDSGRAEGGTARPLPAAQVASGREGAFDLRLGPCGLVQLAAAGREERRRGVATFKWRGRRRGRGCGGSGAWLRREKVSSRHRG